MNKVAATATPDQLDKENFKIALVSIPEMGHFIPVLHIAEELKARGHEVSIVTASYNREKCHKMIQEIGCESIFTADNVSRYSLIPSSDCTPQERRAANAELKRSIKTTLSSLRPDVVVCDYMTLPAIEAADELKLSSVVNYALPLEIIAELTTLPCPRNQFLCCGMLCQKQSKMGTLLNTVLKRQIGSEIIDVLRSSVNRVSLINSFYGLDPVCCLPPNMVMTGPLFKNQTDLTAQLKSKDSALFQWIEEAHSAGQSVVYISLGSMCDWTSWDAKAIYNGLKKLKVKVIWSMKQKDLLPSAEDSDFWISEWVPQVEILAHPAVKVGLCHAGFGGVLEFLTAGKPMALYPHFGDQKPNAEKLIRLQVGESLVPLEKIMITSQVTRSFNEQLFNEDKVFEVFSKLLNNEEYSKNAQKMKTYAITQGGRETAAQTIEKVAACGPEFLINRDFASKTLSISNVSMVFGFIFLIIMVAVTGWLFVEVYGKEEEI